MRKHLVSILAVSALAGAFTTPAAVADPSGHVLMKPDQMKWGPIPSLPPGATVAMIEGPLDQAKPFTIRLKFPANYKIPPHWHPAIEHITVLSGSFMLGMGDKHDESAMQTLPPGSVAIMPAKSHHYAMTKVATEVQLHGVGPWAITYLNPADDPRKK